MACGVWVTHFRISEENLIHNGAEPVTHELQKLPMAGSSLNLML